MEAPRRLAVLLGASNLTLGFARALHRARAAGPGPVRILAAHGPGRSYGRWSRILGRGLPGHLESTLWNELPTAGELPARALLTDIGNDLLYGVSPETLLGWVHECLDRLASAGAETTLSLLPLDSIRALGPGRFTVLRSLLFPGRRETREEVVSMSEVVQAGLYELGARRDVELVAPDPGWYGLDPIHPRRRHRTAAWDRLLESWATPDSRAREPEPAALARLRLRLLRPRRWSYLGVTFEGPLQAAHRWRDGSELWLY